MSSTLCNEIDAGALAATPPGTSVINDSPCPPDRNAVSDNTYQNTYLSNPLFPARPHFGSPPECQGSHPPTYLPASYQWQADEAARQDFLRFVNLVGLQQVGAFCLTFPKKVYSPKVAMEHFNNLNRRIMKRFRRWIRVLERHKDRSWHLHLLVDVGQDIRTGFNIAAFNARQVEFKRAKTFGQRYRVIHECTADGHPLRQLWKDLNLLLPNYGFGRFDLLPVLTDAERVSSYLTKSLAVNTAEMRAAGQRVKLVDSSKTFKRNTKPRLNRNDESFWEYRMKKKVFAERLGCKTPDEVKMLLGPRWNYLDRKLILSLHTPIDACPVYTPGLHGNWPIGSPPLPTYDDLHVSGDYIPAYRGCDPLAPRLLRYDWRAQNEILFEAAAKKVGGSLLPLDQVKVWRTPLPLDASTLPPGFAPASGG